MYLISSFSSRKRTTPRSPSVFPSVGSVMISGMGMKLILAPAGAASASTSAARISLQRGSS
jgi:hypothetical protein